jgi:hypothetical protein
MRHIVWLAGCLLVLSCTVNNDNLNNDAGGTGGCPRCGGTGGTPPTGGPVGTGGASAAGGQVGTGGQLGTGGASATGGQLGTGGASATGGQVGTGGQPGTGGSATGGHGGNGGSSMGGSGGQGGGKSCDALETDYDNALTAAKKCTLGATNQCQQLVNSSLSCAGCKQYVNDTTMLSAIQMEWDDQDCSSAPHVCPAIACVVPTTSVCTSSPTSGDPGGGANSTGTCSPGALTSTN